MLTSKGVMGFGKKKKSPIGFERVVRLLGQERYRAPDNVCWDYNIALLHLMFPKQHRECALSCVAMVIQYLK